MKKITLLILCSFPLSTWAAKISVFAEPFVKSAKVVLGDISDIEGFETVDENLLKQIRLVDQITPGTSHTITNTAISNILAKYLRKTKTSKQNRVILNIPNEVKITRIFEELPKNQIKENLQKHFSGLCLKCKVQLKTLEIPKIDASSYLSWNLVYPTNLPRGNFNFSANIRYINRLGQINTKRIWLRGYTEIWQKVPVFKTSFLPGEKVSVADFEFSERNITKSFEAVFDDKFIPGARVRRKVSSGGIAWESTLEKEKSVLRGQMVHAKLIEGSVEIQLKAIARQDAYVGDRLKLLNPVNKEVIEGTVTAKGEVEIR